MLGIRLIRFVPRVVAESICFSPATALISIGDPGQRVPKVRGTPGAILRLEFVDAIPEDLPPFSPLHATCFGEQDAALVVGFARDLPAHISTAIVHCEAGISRSAAIALYLHAQTAADFPQFDLADLANRHVVELLEEASGLPIEIPCSPDTQFSSFFAGLGAGPAQGECGDFGRRP